MDDVKLRAWGKACWNTRYKKEGESNSLLSVSDVVGPDSCWLEGPCHCSGSVKASFFQRKLAELDLKRWGSLKLMYYPKLLLLWGVPGVKQLETSGLFQGSSQHAWLHAYFRAMHIQATMDVLFTRRKSREPLNCFHLTLIPVCVNLSYNQ